MRKKTNKTSSWRKYPWEEWFAKAKFKLRQGKDFDCNPHVMAQQIRNAATKYTIDGKDVRVSIYVDQKQLTIYVRTR